MSYLKITYDPRTSDLNFENKALAGCCEFIASLERHGSEVSLTGLNYGATVSINDEVVLAKSYPPAGIEYVSTDQDVISSEILSTFPAGAICHVFAWVDIAGSRVENELTFTVPLPPQPYPSWTWGEATWVPPKPYPVDDNFDYVWDEDELNWVIL